MTRAAGIASRLALIALLAAAFLRAMVTLDPFPYWSGDPTIINTPMTSLGPAGSLLIDCISLFAAAVILFAEPLLSRRIQWIPFTLVCLGCIAIVGHASPPGGAANLDNIRIGAGWMAALFGALAAAHAARDPHTARLIAAVTIGFIAILAAKGAVQVFIEHPMTVDEYRNNRDAFLAAQGWAPGSPPALNFERRLNQPEATGWFGLANVVATFGAAATTALLGWTILAWRETRTPDQRFPSGWSGLLTLGALAAMGTLILSGAKGGFAAATLGAALLGAAALISGGRASSPAQGPFNGRAGSPPPLILKLAPILPLALIAAALSALVLRGLIGERLGELSLLFRWFYIETAARIFAAHPILGVGPANFQDAYQLLKPAMSPEEVTSPHSVLFDFASTLGLSGLALSAAFLFWASQAGRALLCATGGLPASANGDPPAPTATASSSRPDLWFLLAVTAPPTLISAWIEAPIATPDSTLMRLLGLSAWVGIALAALALMRLTEAWHIPFAAAAIVLAVHGQIEVTPIWPGATALYFLILAVAGAQRLSVQTYHPPHRLLGFAAGALVGTLALVFGVANLLFGTLGWEMSLAQAARDVEPVSAFRSRYEALTREPRTTSTDSLARLQAEVRLALGRPGFRSFEDDMLQLMARDWGAAQRKLNEFATVVFPTHLPTRLAASRLSLQIATASIGSRRLAAPEWADRAETIAMQATDIGPASAAAWSWLATVRSARFDMDHDPAHLTGAIAAWLRAAALDPHGLSIPVRLMRTYAKLGNAAEARAWAQRALQANANLHLDPLKQLNPADLAEVQRLAAP